MQVNYSAFKERMFYPEKRHWDQDLNGTWAKPLQLKVMNKISYWLHMMGWILTCLPSLTAIWILQTSPPCKEFRWKLSVTAPLQQTLLSISIWHRTSAEFYGRIQILLCWCWEDVWCNRLMSCLGHDLRLVEIILESTAKTHPGFTRFFIPDYYFSKGASTLYPPHVNLFSLARPTFDEFHPWMYHTPFVCIHCSTSSLSSVSVHPQSSSIFSISSTLSCLFIRRMRF